MTKPGVPAKTGIVVPSRLPYEAPTLTYLGNLADPPTRIVDITTEPGGWHLVVERRVTGHCNASLRDATGRERYVSVLAPDAETAIEGAVGYLRHALLLPNVASAIRVNALAELRQ